MLPNMFTSSYAINQYQSMISSGETNLSSEVESWFLCWLSVDVQDLECHYLSFRRCPIQEVTESEMSNVERHVQGGHEGSKWDIQVWLSAGAILWTRDASAQIWIPPQVFQMSSSHSFVKLNLVQLSLLLSMCTLAKQSNLWFVLLICFLPKIALLNINHPPIYFIMFSSSPFLLIFFLCLLPWRVKLLLVARGL